jgi:beta-N-acetylhexosaminidase
LLSGMANCGKHFPGHGYAHGDSHYSLPIDERKLETILKHDAAPYEWLGDALTSIMPAHVIYPQIDTKNAGFSKIWLNDILRKRLGFTGLIFSDDLSMEAAASAGNIVQRARAALNAGCDMVLVCNQPAMADQLLATLNWKPGHHFDQRMARLFSR